MRLMPIDVVVVLATDDFMTHTFKPQERKVVSIEMDHIISELCYKGTLLHSYYILMAIISL